MVEKILARFGYVKQSKLDQLSPPASVGAYDPLLEEFKELERAEEAKKPVSEQVQNLLLARLEEYSIPDLIKILEAANCPARKKPVAMKPY